ncbi:NAD(P)/FAD-dependent oxidoreductase [Pedobacter antarcticus]|uniref:NAD(P)/FAD-dependent oxidoreductase n=1 Tax=Pedobacter antarcticus TaxID=34086 RepID=UPI00292ECC68|nr:NAD(P)/FAD-dependent oxidoreductase [Pedobacter antarcticus]
MKNKPDIFIIGGGLAGLTSAILLSKSGFEVSLAERKKYPFHKVCGEYVSNEVLALLSEIGVLPGDLNASHIRKLIVSSPSGKYLEASLTMGGFGISRYTLDEALYQIASKHGVKFITGEKITSISFEENKFNICSADHKYNADIVIGAYGKRSNLDQKLDRKFFYNRSPYMAVKYHIRSDFAKDTIRLDNFEGGYCGLNKIEDDLYCLCYLSENRHLKKHGSIAEMEKQVLMKNPFLKDVFEHADFVWTRPETINEIAFDSKPLIENHILMCGDTAGMITPLCGNGMAMAFHAAKILSDIIISGCDKGFDNRSRTQLEQAYQQQWQKQFALRLRTGRYIQRFFGSEILSEAVIGGLKYFPALTRYLVKQTHGSTI